jgi:hypothetical protein
MKTGHVIHSFSQQYFPGFNIVSRKVKPVVWAFHTTPYLSLKLLPEKINGPVQLISREIFGEIKKPLDPQCRSRGQGHDLGHWDFKNPVP